MVEKLLVQNFKSIKNLQLYCRRVNLFIGEPNVGKSTMGRSNVSKKLRNSINAIALIDEDPKSPKDKYLQYLFGLLPLYEDSYCMATVDTKTNCKLVVIKPNLEGWSVNLAKDLRIDLTKYDLVNDEKKLHDILRIERNERKRKRFLEFINDIDDHSAIVKLKQLLN